MTWSGNATPLGVIVTDPITSAPAAGLVASYTGITTTGTTVVKASAGVFVGIEALNTGTAMTVVVYDGTASSANVVLGTATVAALGPVLGPPAGVGIRCLTGITVVTGGTMGAVNCLWD